MSTKAFSYDVAVQSLDRVADIMGLSIVQRSAEYVHTQADEKKTPCAGLPG